MSSISSSNTFSVNSYTNKGMIGFASGMDTEGMVKEMLSGTQSKIDKQLGLKQQLTWKQEIYREIIGDINNFKNKFFNLDSAVYLKSNSFFNSMTASSPSKAFQVSGTSSAAAGGMNVVVKQLATGSRLESDFSGIAPGQTASGGLSGKIDAGAAGKTVTFEVGASRREVTVDLGAISGYDGMTAEAKRKALETALNGALGADAAAALESTGKLTIESSEEIWVSGKSGAMGLKMLGLSGGVLSSGSTGAFTLKSTVDPDPQLSVVFALDGKEVTIALDHSQMGDLNLFRADLQSKLDKAFGKDAIRVTDNGGVFRYTTADAGRQIQTAGDSGGLKALGLISGDSSKISTSAALQDVNFSNALQGENFRFSINGVDFAFTRDDSIYTVMRKINDSSAGVRVSYSGLTDRFTMESVNTGAGYGISTEQSQGNLLTAMFGQKAGQSVTSGVLTVGSAAASGGEFPAGFMEGTFSVAVNGRKASISLPRKDGGYTEQEAVTLINRTLERQFGFTETELGQKPVVALTKSASGNWEMEAAGGASVRFDASDGGASPTDLAGRMGFSGVSNRATKDTTLAELGLEGMTGAGDGGKKLSELNGAFQFDEVSGQIVMTGQSIAGTEAITQRLFGVKTVNLTAGLDQVPLKSEGKNAVVVIDGVETERSSNSFTVSGLNFELKAVSAKDGSGNFISEEVSVTRDTGKVLEGLKSFVEEYNKLIEKLNGYVDEDATYKKYSPLTAEQKKEMSEREVELWEEKAREGLLRRDLALDSFLGEMRSAMYDKPPGAKYALYDLGIETGSYQDKGKLTLDETRLKQMLSSDPEAVRQLFTDGENGLAKLLGDCIDRAAKTSSGTPGSLVRIAGVKGFATDKSNDITGQLGSIESRISRLNAQYEKERQRYWNQFNKMEQVIAQFSSQSAWLGQQFM